MSLETFLKYLFFNSIMCFHILLNCAFYNENKKYFSLGLLRRVVEG